MTTDLLPCPKCGGRASVWDVPKDGLVFWKAGCDRGCFESFYSFDRRQRAIDWWNERTPSSDHSALAWTREKPTEPGWYWMHHSHGTLCIVEIIRMLDGVLMMQQRTHGGIGYLGKPPDDAEWCGPIPEPSKPEPAKENP